MLSEAAIHLFCMVRRSRFFAWVTEVASVRLARAAMEEGSPERLGGK